MKLAELAARIGGTVEGDGGVDVVRGASLTEAEPGTLTFLADVRHAEAAKATRASAVVVGKKVPAASVPGIPAIRVEDAYVGFAKALEVLHPPPRPAPGVHALAVVAKTARLGRDAIVEPGAVIEDDVVVGDRAWIGPHVVIGRGAAIGDDFHAHAHAYVGAGCRIGHRVILQPGAVIGADGFGFAKRPDRSYHKIPQVGIAVLGDDCEVQANSCVDRASLGATRLGRGVKLDNLVQVGHNVTIGDDTVLCGQVGIAGSSTLGNRVTLTGQVGVVDHLKVGDDVSSLAQAGILTDIEPGAIVAGLPAIDRRQWWRIQITVQRLPDLAREVKDLRERLARLEERAGKA